MKNQSSQPNEKRQKSQGQMSQPQGNKKQDNKTSNGSGIDTESDIDSDMHSDMDSEMRSDMNDETTELSGAGDELEDEDVDLSQGRQQDKKRRSA